MEEAAKVNAIKLIWMAFNIVVSFRVIETAPMTISPIKYSGGKAGAEPDQKGGRPRGPRACPLKRLRVGIYWHFEIAYVMAAQSKRDMKQCRPFKALITAMTAKAS